MVFVTDGNQRSTLAFVRALGVAGVPVAVGEAASRSLAASSRFCARSVRYPSPLDEPERFIEFLCEELSRKPYRMLVPMTDVTMQLVSEARRRFPADVLLPIAAPDRIRLAQDKKAVLDLAAQVGIEAPATYTPSDRNELEAVAQRLTYPVVIKPRLSKFRRDGMWVSGNVGYAFDAGQLVAQFEEASRAIPSPLIQERIQGEGRGVFLLVWNHELLGAFSHRRLREKPPWGGVSVLRESVPLDIDLLERCLALLRKLEWRGVAMLEFKLDKRTGRPLLMEMNGRFWGSLQLATDSGINFPLLLYRAATGESVHPQFEYRAGVKSRWLLGDLDHLWLSLRRSDQRSRLLSNGASRLQACANFLDFFAPDVRYEVGRWSDPGPGWFELAQYVRHSLGNPGEHGA